MFVKCTIDIAIYVHYLFE